MTTATPSGVRINLVPRRLSDGTVVVDVVLVGGNGEVAGMQNDIVFDTTVLRLDSPADCTINPALSDTPPDPQECVPDANGNVAGACKALGRRLVTCGRSPEPAGCPAGADSTVGVFRGLLAASTNALNSNPIPDGVLYTCTFTVVSESPAPTTLSNSNVVVAATNGAQLPVNAGDGVIELVPSPTATPPIDNAIHIDLVAHALSAGTVSVDVVLLGGGARVAGMQNDIVFDNTVVRLNSPADCTINPAISDTPPNPDDCVPDANNHVAGSCKALGRLLKTCGGSPQAAGCPDGADGTVSVFRALLTASTNALNANPIPDGVLYTCTFSIVDAASLPTTLRNSNVIVADPQGGQLPASAGDAVIGGAPPTAPPTVPPTAPPTATSTATPTNSVPTDIEINLIAAPVAAGTVKVDVVLVGGALRVAGMENEIVFDNTVVQLNSPANCRLNPALSDNPPNPDDCIPDANNNVVGPCKALGRVLKTCGGSPPAPGCPVGADGGTSVFHGLLVASTNALNSNPIPDGVLYTCSFSVVDAARLPTTLINAGVIVAGRSGEALPASAGDATIGAAIAATATPIVP